jgi:hypothetical protein
MVPSTPFDEALTWRDAGVDSLKTLHFLLRLEQVLGRPVSFDLITRDMTLGDLSSALSVPSGRKTATNTGVATVFLVPGVAGDEANLAEFRRSLAGKVHFETLTLLETPPPPTSRDKSKPFARKAHSTSPAIAWAVFSPFRPRAILWPRGAMFGWCACWIPCSAMMSRR